MGTDRKTLIAGARALAQSWRDSNLRYGNEKMLDDLADALEEEHRVRLDLEMKCVELDAAAMAARAAEARAMQRLNEHVDRGGI